MTWARGELETVLDRADPNAPRTRAEWNMFELGARDFSAWEDFQWMLSNGYQQEALEFVARCVKELKRRGVK